MIKPVQNKSIHAKPEKTNRKRLEIKEFGRRITFNH
jgi:hypothetical protein